MYDAADSALSRSERWHSSLLRIWWENKRQIRADLLKATKTLMHPKAVLCARPLCVVIPIFQYKHVEVLLVEKTAAA